MGCPAGLRLLCFTVHLVHLSHCFLHVTSFKALSRVAGPPQPIAAVLHEDVTLPCRLEPAADASGLVVEWGRPDLTPGFIHVRKKGREDRAFKQPSYEGRTSLSLDGLKLGDLSLKISRVQPSDEGRYRCLVPQLGKAAFVDLTVVKPQLIGPSQPIAATVGDDATLPCHLVPAADASGVPLEWSRPDLDPRLVHVWPDGAENETHPSFWGRASLTAEGLRRADVSLKLSKVTLSDEGRYRCFSPTLGAESFVDLTVADSPVSTHLPAWVSTIILSVCLFNVVLGFTIVLRSFFIASHLRRP